MPLYDTRRVDFYIESSYTFVEMKSQLKVFITTVILGVGIYSVVYIIIPKAYVPDEFSAARIKGAELAGRIVNLSNEALARLDEISEHDKEGNEPEALALISQEVIKNRNLQEEAIKLSSQLEKMARSVEEIKPHKARIVAVEAVSSEVALVSRLITYNDLLLQLFTALQGKFENPYAVTNGEVQELINQINDETRAINDFNKRFNESLAVFDKLI